MSRTSTGGRIRFVIVGLAIVAFAALLPISGLTIGTRLWRAGGAWAPRAQTLVGPEELKAQPVALDLVADPDRERSRFQGTSADLRIEGDVVPSLPRTGKLLVRIRPVLTAESTPLTDALITIWLALEDRWLIRAPALNSPVDRGIYVSSIEIDEPGAWRARIIVSTQTQISGFDLALPVAGRVRSGSGARSATFVYMGAVAFVIAGVFWIAISASRRRSRSSGSNSETRPVRLS